jgi:hypothetical protein
MTAATGTASLDRGLIWGAVIRSVLGLAALWVLVVGATGGSYPFVRGDRGAFIALIVIGLLMCGTPSPAGKTGLSIFSALAALAGLAAGYLIYRALKGLPLPYVATMHEAVIALGAIIMVKWGIAMTHLVAMRAGAPS